MNQSNSIIRGTFVLASLCSAALFAGCGPDEDDESSSTTEPELTAAVHVQNWVGVGQPRADEAGHEELTFEDDGGVGCQYAESEFYIDGSGTADLPDLEGELLFQICCEKWSFPFAGNDCDNTNFPFGGSCSEFSADVPRRNFNSRSRQFQPGVYRFTLNVAKGFLTDSVEVFVVLAEDAPPESSAYEPATCSVSGESNGEDVGMADVPADAGLDADLGQDVAVDVEADVAVDAEPDAETDVALDSDVEADVAVDAEPDSATDVAVDPDATDAAVDPDAATDVAVDPDATDAAVDPDAATDAAVAPDAATDAAVDPDAATDAD